MTKPSKECQHNNTVQVGNPGIIETFCADCNELLSVVKCALPYNTVDSHGDIIMPGAFDIPKDKFHLKNHKL
jgi:hypothetical protein